MNILCLAPVMGKTLCDDYFMYIRLQERGANLAFISGRSSGARANSMTLPPYENLDGVPIYRMYRNLEDMWVFPKRRLKDVLKIAKQLNPDIIHCHPAENMRLALLLREYFKIPIVMHTEIASRIRSQELIGSWRMRAVRRLVGLPVKGPAFWSWLCEKADALITSHPPDQQILNLLSENGKPVYYLTWPADIPQGCELPRTRDRSRGVYAGLLIPFKNTQEFEWVLPLILQNTPTKEFVVIGAGVHSRIILRLKQQYGDAITYIPRLKTRCEVMKVIAGSYYGFTPVKVRFMGGFMGDCWGTRTPLLTLHDVFVSKKLDLCVAKNGENLIRKINRLYEDPFFYRQLQNVGYEAYKTRTSNVVGDELYSILQRTLKNARVLDD